MAIDITQASVARNERRQPGRQDTEVPRKVLYIFGGAMLILLVIKLSFGDSVYP